MSQPTIQERLAEVLAKFPPRGLRNLLAELERAQQCRETIAIPATIRLREGKPEALEVLVRATWEGEPSRS